MTNPKYKKVWIKVKHARPNRWKRGWKKLPTWRENIKKYMDWCLQHEPQIHYNQIRPFNPNAIAVGRLPMTLDCSASTTCLYKAVHQPDPNRRDYDGTGFTGTLRAGTPQRHSISAAEVGDFIIYGTGSGVHVVLVYEKAGANPRVFSHGQERGPWLTTHAEQVAAHGSYCTIHNGDAL